MSWRWGVGAGTGFLGLISAWVEDRGMIAKPETQKLSEEMFITFLRSVAAGWSHV